MCIEDRQVSRHHANIFCEHRNVFITDCNGTNHTYVDGREIPAQAPVKLTKDSMVSMGETGFLIYFIQVIFFLYYSIIDELKSEIWKIIFVVDSIIVS